ncbi:MAG: DUF166 domain-containing protein [Candidatus Thorarchaeota archaeon]
MRIAAIYGDEFAERVMGNLINFSKFCQGCEPVCSECRQGYGSYVGDIVGIHKVEPPSPSMIEEPEEYFKDMVLSQCDLLLVVAIHHDLLASIDYIVEKTGAKAVLAPIEDPTWIPPGLREQVKETLDNIGIESAFPKPFCTLEPGEGKIIDEFIETYKVGRPIHYVDLKDGAITEIGPIRSAPCGCTWYVSQKIRGKFIEDTEALFDEISKAHHSYPCTASMAKDRELGDAILHLAGFTARYAVCEAVGIEDCRSRVEKESGHRDSRL